LAPNLRFLTNAQFRGVGVIVPGFPRVNLIRAGLFALMPALSAQAAAAPAVTGNFALTTDYAFRGISQSESSAAVQGCLDLTSGWFYAGTWASSIDFSDLALPASLELDLYAGVRPALGPVSLDLGVIFYAYPNADEGAAGYGEMNYLELTAKASGSPARGLTIGAALNYSPEFTLETGRAWYAEANALYVVNPSVSISGAVGYQTIQDVTGVFNSLIAPFSAERRDSYTTWNIGATYTALGVGFDLRWVDTDVASGDALIQELYALKQSVEGRAILSIKKAF
jgi:uncharacterized protein (TIGR02001 family)